MRPARRRRSAGLADNGCLCLKQAAEDRHQGTVRFGVAVVKRRYAKDSNDFRMGVISGGAARTSSAIDQDDGPDSS
jgi:hypothetical protein